jgi:hypothetical protein
MAATHLQGQMVESQIGKRGGQRATIPMAQSLTREGREEIDRQKTEKERFPISGMANGLPPLLSIRRHVEQFSTATLPQ